MPGLRRLLGVHGDGMGRPAFPVVVGIVVIHMGRHPFLAFAWR